MGIPVLERYSDERVDDLLAEGFAVMMIKTSVGKLVMHRPVADVFLEHLEREADDPRYQEISKKKNGRRRRKKSPK